jgi:hypothetical protein
MSALWIEQADSPFVARLLAPLDRHLRRRQGIYEFSVNPECVFRLQVLRLQQAIALSDGTAFKPGERVIDLHLWNEHIPRLEPNVLRWAGRMSNRLFNSLRELALYLRVSPELSDVVAIRANMSFGTPEQTAQLERVSKRYGFEPVAVPDMPSAGERLHRFGENILITFFVLALNKAALRRDTLWRGRTQVFLSRAALEQKYGNALPRRAEDLSRASTPVL